MHALFPALVFAMCLAKPGPATADRYWVCGDGDWTNGACWSTSDGGAGGAGQPLSGDGSPFITSTDAQDRTVTYSFDAPFSLSNLRVNGTGSGTPTLEQVGGTLEHFNFAIGATGNGVFSQSGGANVINVGFNLGAEAGANGTFNLTDGSVSTVQSSSVGDYGTGFFSQSGGTLSVGSHVGAGLYIGANAGGNGTYQLSGAGALTTQDTRIGRLGTGSFIQSGGTHTVLRDLELGGAQSGDGTYEMSAGELVVIRNTVVGASGTAEFIQHAGTHTAVSLGVGQSTGSTGTYNLHGGELSTSYEVIGGRGVGHFNHTGGVHTLDIELRLGANIGGGESSYDLSGAGVLSADEEYIGGNGQIGTFNQSGGTNTVGSAMVFAAPSGATSSYTLSGGDLFVTSGVIFGQGKGVINIDGGTLTLGNDTTANVHTMAQFNVGHAAASVGAFVLHDGQVLYNTFYETIGHDGSGTFTQQGGENDVVNVLTIAANPGSAGTYNLQGGSLSAREIQNNGTFNYTGGALSTDVAFVNGQAQPVGIDENAHFNIDNTTVTVSGDVINYGTLKLTDANVSFTGFEFTNHGVLTSDPSSSFFSNLTVTGPGYLIGGAGDEFFVEGDFLNFSEQVGLWDTTDAYLAFTGAGAHEFRLGDAGSPGDFGWGTLEILDGAKVLLSGDTAVGLFIANVILGPGTSLDLNGAEIVVNSLVDLGGNYFNGNIVIEPAAVPLPAAAWLFGSAFGLLAWVRRK